MASTRTNRATGPALSLFGALAALGAASAINLARVFEGRVWIFAVLGAVVFPLAIGWWVDRYRVNGLQALAAWLVGAWYYSIVVAVPGLTARGLPTPVAVRGWFDALRAAPDILRTATTPVTPISGALLLAVLATWAANAAASWSATRLDGSLGAIVPTLALFVAVSALGEGDYTRGAALYAGATGAFLLVRHQVALTDRRSWFHARPQRRSQLVAGGAATIVFIALVGAMLGPSLPSAQSAGLIDYEEWGEGRGGSGTVKIVSPLVNIGDQLNSPDEAEVFTVASNVRTYWRLAALDDYDGDVWGLHDTTAKAGYPEVDTEAPTRALTQRFVMGPLGGPFLPAAYQAVETRFLAEELSIHESATLFLSQDNYDGLRYEVDSLIPWPTEADLAAIGPVDPDEFADQLALPDDFPDEVADLAVEVTEGADTPYEQALALQTFFRDPTLFTYDTEIAGHDEDALARFVLEERRGFCEQFAGSYAAMARSIGLPTRVAVGFTSGELRDGVYHVTTKNAHAWPEVWFEGIGWVRFEPTPGRYEPTATDYNDDGDDPNAGGPGASTTSTSVASTTSRADGGPSTPSTIRPPRNPIETGPGNSDATRSVGSPLLLRVALGTGIVAAAVATMVGVMFAGAALRRRRRARGQPRDRVLGAWAQALERLAEAGVRRRPSATPVEFAMREAPAAGIGGAGPALLALSHLQTDALYAPDPPSDADAEAAWEHVGVIERAIAATTRRSVRWKRRIRVDR